MRLISMMVMTTLAAVVSSGCGVDDAPETSVGGLSMTLATTSDRGVDYRLRNYEFLIRGAEDVIVRHEDYPDTQRRIDVNLDSGSYDVFLLSDWFIEYSIGGQPFMPIPATLVSQNPIFATVVGGQGIAVTFQFQVDESLIDFGPGTLLIGIDVDEVEPDETCTQTCGVGNEIPAGATDDSEIFTCSVMGIGLGLEMRLAGVPETAPVGDVDLALSMETIISRETVNLIVNLADSADITATTGVALPANDTTGAPADFVLSGTPCKVCFERDTEVRVVIDPSSGSYETTGAAVDVELAEVTVEIDAAGIALILSNVGDDPACCWGTNCNTQTDSGPVISFASNVSTGACTNGADGQVFAEAEWTNEFNQTFFDEDAVAQIARACVFGSSALVNPGCGQEVGVVLGNNTPENRSALGNCVDQCTIDQGIGLSPSCQSCYGDTVTCGAAFCAGPCAGGVNTAQCQACGCEANCFRDFDICTGFAPDDSCDI